MKVILEHNKNNVFRIKQFYSSINTYIAVTSLKMLEIIK